MFALAAARSATNPLPQMHSAAPGARGATSPLPQMHLTRTLPRRSAVHRRHQPAMSARAPGEDDEDGEDISEGWRPEVELARLRLESVLSESEEDLSDPDTWAAQTDLLKQRAARVGEAEERGKRNKRKEVVDAVGGLAFGAAFLGASWAVKEGLLPAEAALGGIGALSQSSHRPKRPFGSHGPTCPFGGMASLGLLAGALGAGGLLGNWRGEDVAWRAEQERLRQVKQRRRDQKRAEEDRT